MASLRYLTWSVYFLLGVLIGGGITFNAYAETIPAQTGYVYYYGATQYSDAGAMCSAFYNAQIAPLSQYPDRYNGGPNATNTNCVYYLQSGTSNPQYYSTSKTSIGLTCPTTGGWTLSGQNCTRPDCPAGYTREANGSCTPPPITCQPGEVNENNVCVPDCNHESRNLAGQNFGGQGAYTPGGQLCIGGCTYNTNNGITGCKSGACMFEAQVGAATGGRCTPPTNPVTMKNDDTRTPEEKCLANKQGYITTNGVTTCVASGTAGAPVITVNDKPSTTTNPTGTTSQVKTTVVNPDGTVTQTTTTTPPGGTPTTETKTQPKATFCEENPNSQFCKPGNISGSCDQGFFCDGDAVNCAIARAQLRQNCINYDQATDLSNLGNSLANQADPSDALNTFKTADVTNVTQALDQTNPYASSGLTDQVISLGSHGSLTIPFSDLNAILQVLGSILVAIAFVASGRIIGVY